MKTMKTMGVLLAGGCGGLLVAASSASADFIINHSDLPAGQNSAAFSFAEGNVQVDVASIGGNFASKNAHGVAGMGISGGSVHGEIDGEEMMSFIFSEPVIITELEIAYLYTAGNFGDVWNEVALFSTDIGDFTLEASEPTSGDWTGFGTLTNVSPGEEHDGGAWRVSGEDIFGGAITSLSLMSGNAGNHAKYGDFSFVNMQSAQLPTPGAFALMFAAGLVGCSRRRG